MCRGPACQSECKAKVAAVYHIERGDFMPVKDTTCIYIGNWIIGFYVVYIITGIAAFLAVVVLASQILRIVRRRRLARRQKLTLVLDRSV
jgi:hypothetical protein